MAWPVQLALLLAEMLGHFAMTVWLFNRLHALAMPRPRMKALERLLLLLSGALVLIVVSRWLLSDGSPWPATGDLSFASLALRLYAVVTCLAAIAVLPCWLVPKLRECLCPKLVSNDTRRVDVSERLGYPPVDGVQTRWFAKLPGNELLTIAVQQKTLQLQNLPQPLSGLKIAHLSDLHMTGQLTQAFYEVAVAETNALSPDLVLITGDILEKEKCLPWIGETLAKLQARDGKFFILGNHEYRLKDPMVLRAALTAAGFTDLGSRVQMVPVGDSRLLLAGNERPWFGSLPEVPTTGEGNAFRLLLSHTPDQLPWAKANGFDLMLAGHNHGGQIRLPYFGALIAPSRYGCRYAGGIYYEEPTLLHVSRGLSAIHPIRINCPPEITLLILRPEAS